MSDQYTDIEQEAVVLVDEETFSFYANLDTLETDANFSNWHLDLLFVDFTTAVQDIGTLTQDIITGSSYRFYSSFTVPPLTSGCYYLAVIDETYNQVKYLSQALNATTVTEHTKQVKFRNNRNISNFNYEGLPSFYNTFRIRLVTRQETPDTTSIGYDLVDGSFNPVRYTKGVTKEFITLWFDADNHTAFNSATTHSDFFTEDDGAYVQFVRGDADYEIEWLEDYPLAEGTVRLQRKDSYSSNKTL